jgi:hypothetical protein
MKHVKAVCFIYFLDLRHSEFHGAVPRRTLPKSHILTICKILIFPVSS